MAFDDNHNSIKHQAHSIVYQGGKEEGGGGAIVGEVDFTVVSNFGYFQAKIIF